MRNHGIRLSKVSKLSIKQQILKSHGIGRKPPTKYIEPHKPNPLHTKTMAYLELRYGNGQTLEYILMSGSLNQVVHKLGDEVDRSTISKWIKQFKLRFTPDNLPSCDGCTSHEIVCEQGICPILIDRSQWNLIGMKRNEVMDNK